MPQRQFQHPPWEFLKTKDLYTFFSSAWHALLQPLHSESRQCTLVLCDIPLKFTFFSSDHDRISAGSVSTVSLHLLLCDLKTYGYEVSRPTAVIWVLKNWRYESLRREAEKLRPSVGPPETCREVKVFWVLFFVCGLLVMCLVHCSVVR